MIKYCALRIDRGSILVVLVATSAAATCPMAAAAATDAVSDPSWSQYLADTWLNFRVWVGQAFEESPAIVLGLGFTLCVPVLVLLGAFMRRGQSDSAPSYDEVPQTVPVSAWQNEGVLIDVNNGGKHHTVGHGLVRIGREEDNDVQLVHKTVHRYHAIIERTPEAEFVLTDVSGDGGNGVRVDGERIERLRLRGGEVIDIGRIQLQFQLLQI